jgi:hypothetical protein
MAWVDSSGQKVHGLYQELLEVGNSLMRVEDHLTMGIPGADIELENMKDILLRMLQSTNELIAEVREETHA